MHPQLTYLIAQERVARLRRAAERSRPTAAEPLLLADGRRLKIRPIEPRDRDRLRRLFMRLTPESRYRRYLSPKPELTEHELTYLVDIDHVHHEALAAVDESDGSFVAAARYVQLPDQPRTAEVAIEVADDAQRQGIGTELAIQTLQRARANGITHVTATTLHQNAPARALLRALHFRRRARNRHEIEFGLELTPVPSDCGRQLPRRSRPAEPSCNTRGATMPPSSTVIAALFVAEAQLGLAERVSQRARPGRRDMRPVTAHQRRLGLKGDSIRKGPTVS
ncbi:MAG TPA: GNAT family N-acetyltransferase [Solirubrobacteraceae bacterium]|nr:GNAT family N-acetyltransferase [Solirubrobacteraceae bacterium]